MEYFRTLPAGEEEKKLLLVSGRNEQNCVRWRIVDPLGELEEEEIAISSMKGPNLDIVRSQSVVVVESSIYFIGGIQDHPHGDKLFTDVHVYNIKSDTWSKAPPINHPRIFPFVFVVGRKIYVFGSLFYHPPGFHVPEREWVECYDLDSPPGSGWVTFPAPIQDDETIKRFFTASLRAGVVYGDQIRFWGPCTAGIFAFNFSSNTWSFTSEVPFLSCGPKPPLDFMDNHVVCGHLVLWQFRGKLSCWDLTKNTTVELCTLKDVDFPKPFPSPSQFGPPHLLHLGNGLLCLVRWRKIDNSTSQLCCYKFQVDHSLLQSGTGGVHAAGVHFFHVPCHGNGHIIMLDVAKCGLGAVSRDKDALIRSLEKSSGEVRECFQKDDNAQVILCKR